MSHKIRARFFLELGDAHVTDIIVEHFAANAAHTNRVTNDFNHQRLRLTLANNGQSNWRLDWATHELDRISQRQAFSRLIIDL